jgi:hypothetical protein
MNKVKKTYRGWPGHFCGAHNCIFHLNTLLEYEDKKLIVSTVGNYKLPEQINQGKPEFVDMNREAYYETMVFHSKNDEYNDIDASKEIWQFTEYLSELDDNKANNMHEKVIEKVSIALKKGEIK